MNVLGLDFETTFTDPINPREARIIEIGAVLWDTTRKTPLVIVNRTVWHESYNYDNRIEDLTGMNQADLQRFGCAPKFALEKLLKLIELADAIVAHNGNGFDKPVLESELARHGLEMPSTPWIDTTSDIQYPEKIHTRKLEFLAPSHGFLNPFSHRALFDVLSMLKVMSQYDFENIFARSKMPDITLKADIAKPFGATASVGKRQNQEAKDRGYRYDGDTKSWTKRIKEDELEKESKEAPFPIIVLR
jgi:DNA polymerase III alpha subunit (gram-positive type)